MHLAHSDSFGQFGQRVWRVEAASRRFLCGPWCYTRRHAMLSWLLGTLGISRSPRFTWLWNWSLGPSPKQGRL